MLIGDDKTNSTHYNSTPNMNQINWFDPITQGWPINLFQAIYIPRVKTPMSGMAITHYTVGPVVSED